MSDDRGDSYRIHWPLVATCFAIGASLAVIAFFVPKNWSSQLVIQSILIEVGSTVGLFGLLATLTPKIYRVVVDISERAAENVADQVDARLQAQSDGTSMNLAELQDRIKERQQRRAQMQDQVVEALDIVSFESVAMALHEANRNDAIDQGRITVAANAGAERTSATFSWGSVPKDFKRGPAPRLLIEVRTGMRQDSNPPTKIETVWERGQAADEIADIIIQELYKAGQWRGEESLNFPLTLENFQKALKIAIAAKRKDQNSWQLQGTPIELFNDELIITTAGIEAPGHDFILRGEEFPYLNGRWRPTRPKFVSPSDWEQTIRIGQEIFPRRQYLMDLFSHRFIPWGSSPMHEPPVAIETIPSHV
ncbi:hypothetical protein Lfu02_43530 [Longispora fulva]|uniref:TolA-binding protein n=1 Tax=Longispora fulva TaxID=619741 RepID=A0A8J7GF99_9ACTN|nr:hypothetical protein [Longispora fulva]MBG6136810.1 TolA-binding protein [Longispora fulva]GIG59981.1 hypothetical protein Lfu02_43530 [Longispora fulva]